MEKYTVECEIRALGNGRQIKARVNDYTLSKKLLGNNGYFRERISKEVWEKAIARAEDIKTYINHEPYIDIMENVELRAEEDGVYLYGTLIEKAEGVYKAIQEGVINSVSFGFRALKDTFKQATDYLERTIEDMDLFEVSLLSKEAAYFGTKIEARALDLPVNYENDLDLKQRQLNLYKLM